MRTRPTGCRPARTWTEAAFAEPLSVCLHAARQAGPLLGTRVLVSGCGPIGALSVLVARHGGAREVVVTDLLDEPLALARRIGADGAINMATAPDGLAGFGRDKGTFDVVFEASGAARPWRPPSAPRGRARWSCSWASAARKRPCR